jgi:hypothetical protein
MNIDQLREMLTELVVAKYRERPAYNGHYYFLKEYEYYKLHEKDLADQEEAGHQPAGTQTL